jgi:hypothetical protein
MLVAETTVRIRRGHVGGTPIKVIAWDLKLSRKLVRKAIRAPEGAFDYHRTVQPLPQTWLLGVKRAPICRTQP